MRTAEEIIQHKTFSTLSPEEMQIVSELANNEAEFDEMKRFFKELENIVVAEKTTVSADIKSSLDAIFQAKHPGITANWTAETTPKSTPVIPLYNRTWFRVAAVALLSASAIPFLFDESIETTTKKTALAKTETASEKNKTTATSPINETVAEQSNEKIYTKGKEVASVFLDASAENIKKAIDIEPSVSPGTYSFNYTAKSSATVVEKKQMATEEDVSFGNAGRMADLYPNASKDQASLATGIDPTDLLEFITPAF